MTTLRIEGKAEIVAHVELLDDGRMRIHDVLCLGIEFPIPQDGQVQDAYFDWVEVGAEDAARISYGLLSVRADHIGVEHEEYVSTGEPKPETGSHTRAREEGHA